MGATTESPQSWQSLLRSTLLSSSALEKRCKHDRICCNCPGIVYLMKNFNPCIVWHYNTEYNFPDVFIEAIPVKTMTSLMLWRTFKAWITHHFGLKTNALGETFSFKFCSSFFFFLFSFLLVVQTKKINAFSSGTQLEGTLLQTIPGYVSKWTHHNKFSINQISLTGLSLTKSEAKKYQTYDA